MTKKEIILLPNSKKVLSHLGENIRFARLRRRLSAQQVAERAGISRPTLHSIELGLPTVSIGLYFQVLLVLGLENDILQVAQDDILGRKLQDANLITKGRSPKRTTPHE